MKRLLLVQLFLLLVITLCGIEVGGHISQDTTWFPENNPYVITSFLYIERGATLTIIPGTQVRCTGADKSSIYNFMWSGNTQPVSKMIIVNGAIKAVGTSDNPISFDKYQADRDYRWGGIYIAPNAPISTFEYCEFRNAFFCDYMPGEWSLGAVEFDNGIINVRSCTFENNLNAIRTGFLQDDILLYDCRFISIDDTYPTPFGMTGFIGFSASPEPEPENHYKVTIAKCYFTGTAGLGPVGYYMDILYLNNVADNFIGRSEKREDYRSEYGSVSSYGNILMNGRGGWGCTSATATDTVFARRNIMMKPMNANPSNSPLILGSNGFGTNYVSDNYMSGSVQVSTMQTNATTTYMYNNIIENNSFEPALDFDNSNQNYQGGQIRFFNNMLRYTGDTETFATIINDSSPSIYNNTILNYDTLQLSMGSYHTVYTNNIIDVTNSYGYFDTGYYPWLINNCLSIPIPTQSSIYSVGNIMADPMFADTLNADYSLSADSPCIDAGAYRPDLPDFDIRYHKRIAPGVPNGQPLVDIGAYEYNSVYIGGLRGYVFNPDSGEMIDCVKIQIGHKLPEFSDSLGCFEYPTGPGVYTVRASRWDYDDQIIENVVVTEGELALIAIPMYLSTTSADDPSVSPNLTSSLRNYPNPFNPSTTISFQAPETGELNLAVYNLKGQRVKTLHKGQILKGQHNILWNGLDERGAAVGSGIYIVRLELNGLRQSHRMMLIK